MLVASSRLEGAMKTAAMVMGITGGVTGLVCALLAAAVGSFDDGNELLWLSVSAFVCSIVAIVGGELSGVHAGWAAGLMFVAGIGIIASISVFGLVPGILTLLGSLFAFVHRRNAKQPASLSAVPTH
jgi:hypothetical protein